ncbi:synaptotagmin-like protein 2 isoform X12 [Hyperolius riggenbachi]|uniref:synaptotagmin-like protein 2 isoform X12 n=1 Tax=Hyperolius riggenbachi TaxID=752182 RepID=UPI0035A3794D
MIDLSFLTEAEQESILKVLNRDSELKKAEDERVRQLHNAVDDENEFKYKSGQWFYDAKSRRHRDKVHGADLVRASIRKRKKPQTLAELSESNKDYSKRRWVNSVNQDIFIPPELSGVIMEAPDEAEEDIALKKEAGTESSNKVNDTTSPEKGPDTLKNGAVPSSKQRLNPFNTEGLKDETDYKNEPPSLTPEIEATKPPKSKSDIMSSLAKYGVRLPYAADLPKGPQVSSKAKDDDHAQNQAVPPPVPKPRTLRMNGQQDASNSSLKSEDSFNGLNALYAAVRKTPPATSPQQSQDKNPEVASPEALNSKPGMDESHPILSALKRSAAKTLNSKAALDISPTSANQINASSPTEDTTGPVENSFPENAEKFKRMSQSVPAFLQDEICPCAPDVLTDGRDTDSASESSFQIGRHKKSPSSLTNLSGSSGMASMSSVSGSVMSVYSGDFGNVDVKGGIEFQVVYMDQLKEFFIYVYQCKDLAAADVKKQRSDPYVKAYLLPEKAKMGKRKTAVKKKTLDPVYNEILKYKIPKQSLLAQTLNLSVWHHDALGRNSFLGEVNLNLATVDWDNKDRAWYQLQPRTPSAGIGLENRGEMKLSLKYVPRIPSETNTKAPLTGEVHIWIRECVQLPKLRDKINSFVKCTVLPDTSRKSRQKTRTVDKTPNPIFNHTMVYDGFKTEDLREACVELTVWDHNRLSNHFLGGLRIGLGSGKSYGTVVDWMDSTHEESTMWEKMMASPNIWVDGMLPLRMFKMAKLAK